MRSEDVVRRQLVKRLKQLQVRAKALAAEITVVERLLVDVERHAQSHAFKLRKNSVAKWTIQAQITTNLQKAGYPLRAQFLLEKARESDPNLNSSTFRSHLKRMVDSGVLKREGGRGRYGLVQKPQSEPEEPRERVYQRPKRRFSQD